MSLRRRTQLTWGCNHEWTLGPVRYAGGTILNKENDLGAASAPQMCTIHWGTEFLSGQGMVQSRMHPNYHNKATLFNGFMPGEYSQRFDDNQCRDLNMATLLRLAAQQGDG